MKINEKFVEWLWTKDKELDSSVGRVAENKWHLSLHMALNLLGQETSCRYWVIHISIAKQSNGKLRIACLHGWSIRKHYTPHPIQTTKEVRDE